MSNHDVQKVVIFLECDLVPLLIKGSCKPEQVWKEEKVKKGRGEKKKKTKYAARNRREKYILLPSPTTVDLHVIRAMLHDANF